VLVVGIIKDLEESHIIPIGTLWEVCVILADHLIESLQVDNEDLFLPLAGGLELEIVVIQKNSGLKGTGHESTGRALILFGFHAPLLAKNGEWHDWDSNLIEANSLCSVSGWDAFGGLLDIRIILKPGQVALPVLQRSGDKTPLARYGLKAEVIECDIHPLILIHSGGYGHLYDR
jgi:hypothetical protein